MKIACIAGDDLDEVYGPWLDIKDAEGKWNARIAVDVWPLEKDADYDYEKSTVVRDRILFLLTKHGLTDELTP